MQPIRIEQQEIGTVAWELFNESHDQFLLLRDKYLTEDISSASLSKLIAQIDQDTYSALTMLRKAHRAKLENTLIDIGIRAFAGVLVLRAQDVTK